MSRCYILGAGFSKPFGLPLAAELTPLLFTHVYPADFWQPFVRDNYLSYLRRLYPKMDFKANWPDFEDLVTMLNEWESYRQAYEQTETPQEGLHPTHFKEVLLKHLGYQLCEQGEKCSGPILDVLDGFVERAFANNDMVISFNWDVLVEIACERVGFQASYGGQTSALVIKF